MVSNSNPIAPRPASDLPGWGVARAKRDDTTKALRRLLRASEPFIACGAEGMEEVRRRLADPVMRRCGALPLRLQPHVTPRRFTNLVEAVDAARAALGAAGARPA